MRASTGQRGFTLAELLVVTGIIALLVAIMLPPLHAAHAQAKATRCAAQVSQLGLAIEATRNEHRGYYPLWDDGGSPTRYTWIDLLVQQRVLSSAAIGYCPDDAQPSAVNRARGRHFGVRYPGQSDVPGIDYSYGIAVPLSAAGWIWQPSFNAPGDARRHMLQDYERYPGSRVLAADAHWSTIYNLSGHALNGHSWSYPTLYDNMVAYRHKGPAANVLYQDGHVSRVAYNVAANEPVNTAKSFVWFPGEPLDVAPGYVYNDNHYPNIPPIDFETGKPYAGFPSTLAPIHYTRNLLWTCIENK